MDQEELYELKGQIEGVQMVLSAALNGLSGFDRQEIAGRLQEIEDAARKRGAHAQMIETVRAFRETLSGQQ
jgi:hypothetical protein